MLYLISYRAFCRLGSPLCSKSSYAVLRASSQKGSDSIDNSNNKKISLTVCNGDIQFSSNKPDSSSVKEENELQTNDLDISGSRNSLDQLSTHSDENLQKKVESTEENETNDTTDETLTVTDSTSNEIIPSNPKSIPDEKPTLRKRDSSNLLNSLTSSYSAISRIESLLDDEFEDELDGHSDDLKEEIMRICDRFEGRPLPQNLVKSVVSLTTPRDVLSTTPLEPPSFVEFSMSEDGYGCLFIPSLTPQLLSTSKFTVSFIISIVFTLFFFLTRRTIHLILVLSKHSKWKNFFFVTPD